MSALDRVRKVGEGATINGTYAMAPEPALEAFRKDLLLLTTVSQPSAGLLAHFKQMQEMASRYILPSDQPYVSRDDVPDTIGGPGLQQPQRNWLFANDMVYMLDGPEQRAAQRAPQTADELIVVIRAWLDADVQKWGAFEKRLDAAISEPHVGDGTGDAALAIAEHAFKAGFDQALEYLDLFPSKTVAGMSDVGWSEYDPPEEIKALS